MTAAAVIERLQVADYLEIAVAMGRIYHVDVADICGVSRLPHIVAARHATWWELRDKFGIGDSGIARLFGCDPSTVRYVRNKPKPIPPTALGKSAAEVAKELLASAGLVPDEPRTNREQVSEKAVETTLAPASRALSDQDLDLSQSSLLTSTSDSDSSCLEGQAKAEAKSSSNGLEQVTPIGAAKSKRRAPELPLPDDWAPTPDHYDLGRSRGIDVDAEAASFRAHAETHDRRAVRWGAAFRHWLLRAQPARTGSRTLVQRDDPTKRLWKIPEGF